MCLPEVREFRRERRRVARMPGRDPLSKARITLTGRPECALSGQGAARSGSHQLAAPGFAARPRRTPSAQIGSAEPNRRAECSTWGRHPPSPLWSPAARGKNCRAHASARLHQSSLRASARSPRIPVASGSGWRVTGPLGADRCAPFCRPSPGGRLRRRSVAFAKAPAHRTAGLNVLPGGGIPQAPSGVPAAHQKCRAHASARLHQPSLRASARSSLLPGRDPAGGRRAEGSPFRAVRMK
jgi:hypothetical protein